MRNKLYAIYKNGEHKGNERGLSVSDAINKYIISSILEDFLNDKEFMSQYTGKIAINGVHYN